MRGRPATITVNASAWARVTRERDGAREELQQWRDAAKGAENPHPDEVHCACVPLLLGSLALAQKERDEAREQNEEQARLLAMSADREEKLRAQLQDAEIRALYEQRLKNTYKKLLKQ